MSLITSQTHALLVSECLSKLQARKINTIYQFLDTDITVLATITGLTYKNISIIRKHILNKNSAIIHPANELYKTLIQKTSIIPTGFAAINSLLTGGFYTGNIYEICGLPASGKTLFCYKILQQCADNFSQPALYIDTKYDFAPTKLAALIKPEKHVTAMGKITIKQINTIHDLVNSLYEIKDRIIKNLRLIIIDALPPLLYQVADNVKSNALLNCFVNVMRFIAVEYHVVFIVVNVVTTWRDGNEFSGSGDCTEKVGCGKYWHGVPNTRLKCAKVSADEYEMSILNSSHLKQGLSAKFKL